MTVTTDEHVDAAEPAESELDEPQLDEPEGDGNEVDAAEAAPAEEQPQQRRNWRRRVAVGAVALVFIAALAVSGVLGWKVWEQHQLAVASKQAQDAAVAYAQVLTSIDSAKVDENFNQVLDGATGEFKDMYSQSSNQLRQLLIDNKATAHGVVLESAVQSASPTKVVVLLFVDQSVANTNVPDPRIDRSRIKMTMELVDGRWRASQVVLP